jgi:hypothetical protein
LEKVVQNRRLYAVYAEKVCTISLSWTAVI